MRKLAIILLIILAAMASAAGGYRFGTGHWPSVSRSHLSGDVSAPQPVSSMGAPKRRVLYWKDPDGKPAFAANPAKTADRRDYVPVYEDEEPLLPGDKPKPTTDASEDPAARAERKIKYYRNPMGLPDISPIPKKDGMGMDYIAVYEGEEDDGTSVKVSLDKIQRTGVRSEEAAMRRLVRPVRAPAVAKIDERTIRDVVLRADGYIEKLYVAETGKHVKAGDPLFRVYSPDMVRAQVDYGIAKGASATGSRADAAKTLEGATQRLENLDIPQRVVTALQKGQTSPTMKIDWPSPVSGVVLEKKAIEGQKFASGDLLFRLGDLGKIWVIADVAEQDLGQVKVGDPATVAFRAFPGELFEGKVTFILHEVEAQTRTGKVRIEIANPYYRIRHDMYADVTLDIGRGDSERLAVPVSAVLDTGARQAVLMDKGEGRFEPRQVKLGVRGDGFIEIREGLVAGDKVVTSANFLIDAESNLKAALKAFEADAPPTVKPDARPATDPMTHEMGSHGRRAINGASSGVTP